MCLLCDFVHVLVVVWVGRRWVVKENWLPMVLSLLDGYFVVISLVSFQLESFGN